MNKLMSEATMIPIRPIMSMRPNFVRSCFVVYPIKAMMPNIAAEDKKHVNTVPGV